MAVRHEIVALLEPYLTECLRYGPDYLWDWWSDGVEHLEIEHTAANSFKLLGVTWIACAALAPFEIDVELNADDDRCFAKTTFRIGARNDRGQPKLASSQMDPCTILRDRPQRNRDWAMAVELTPTDK